MQAEIKETFKREQFKEKFFSRIYALLAGQVHPKRKLEKIQNFFSGNKMYYYFAVFLMRVFMFNLHKEHKELKLENKCTCGEHLLIFGNNTFGKCCK